MSPKHDHDQWTAKGTSSIDLVESEWINITSITVSSHSPTLQDQFNVLDLTLMLKVMGFRLHYLDYEGAPNPSAAHQALTIEIKCGKQNLVSRLSAPAESCKCPSKSEDQEHDNSFWEVLGTAPNSSPGTKKKVH